MVSLVGSTSLVPTLGIPYDTYLKSIAGIDWFMTQELLNSVAYATNSALSPGRRLNTQTYAAYVAGAGWSNPSAQLATHAAAGGTATLAHAGILAIGKTFEVVTIISGRTAGSVILTGTGAVAMTADDTYTDNITALGTALTYTPTTDFDGTINCATVTVKQTGILGYEQYPGAELLNTAGASGTATAANWTEDNATASNPSAGVLRITGTGVSNPFGHQTPPLTTGKRYKITAEARSDGNSSPLLAQYLSFAGYSSGTTSTDWQDLSGEFVVGDTGIRIGGDTATAGHYTEWRNISVREANPMNGDYTSVTLGGVADGNLGYAPLWDGVNDNLAVVTAEKNSKTDPTSYHELIWVQKDTWDTTERDILSFTVDANNWIRIVDTTTAGTISWQHRAGGTTEEVTLATGSPTGWFLVGISVESGVMKAWYNEAQTGADQSVAGTFVGNFVTMNYGSRAASHFHKGSLTRAGSATSELPVTTVSDIYYGAQI